MIDRIDINDLTCLCCNRDDKNNRIAYILYPIDTMLADWIEPVAEKYGIAIAVITGMDWQNVFSPWPARGVPAGSPDFKGESPEFLTKLRDDVIPQIERKIGMNTAPERTLVGVSMSGLFALWQWMECDTFRNIASLSGSFWYRGFMHWLASLTIPSKDGLAYFLLGKQEPKSPVKAFDSVGANTLAIVKMLADKGIKVKYESVPGNHYSDPIERLDRAFCALYAQPQSFHSGS